ncbi:hypothetical protein RB195_005215 [Necator americanus]|uniref:Sodium:neurotransmitter symporter family protein n=1 Tax=Necator americanus TaxID=51031 RepID=A0ABR1BLR2_NECAM
MFISQSKRQGCGSTRCEIGIEGNNPDRQSPESGSAEAGAKKESASGEEKGEKSRSVEGGEKKGSASAEEKGAGSKEKGAEEKLIGSAEGRTQRAGSAEVGAEKRIGGSAEGRTQKGESVEGGEAAQYRRKSKSAEDGAGQEQKAKTKLVKSDELSVRSREQIKAGSAEGKGKTSSVAKKVQDGMEQGKTAQKEGQQRGQTSKRSVSTEGKGQTFTASKSSEEKARKSRGASSDEYPYDSRTTASPRERERQQESLSESIESEDIVVLITEEDRDYMDRITIGKLSRAGIGQTFRWSKVTYYCVVVSYASSIDSIAMFNYCVARLGIYWMIPFLLSMYFVGFPLTYLELALGQYTHSSALTIFSRIAPISVGIGVSSLLMLIGSTIIGTDFMEVMITVFIESFDMFINELPFENCVASSSRSYCQSLARNCSLLQDPLHEVSHSDAFDHQKYEYMGIGDTCVTNAIKSWNYPLKEGAMEQKGFVNKLPIVHFAHSDYEDFEKLELTDWPHPFSLIITIGTFSFMAFLLSYRRRFVAWISYTYMALMFIVTITIFLVYSYISPPAFPASHVFDADLKLFNTETWLTAIILAVLVLRLGYGGMIFLGSQNQFHNDLATDAMVITAAVSFIYVSQAMLHILVRDSFMVEATSGDFVVFSSLLREANDFSVKANRAGSRLMSLYLGSFKTFRHLQAPMTALVSLFGIFAAFTSKVVRIEVLFSTVQDYIGIVPERETRISLMCLVCLFMSLFSLMCFCPRCHMLEISFETIVLPNAVLVILLGELFIVCGLYGTRRFFSNVSTMIMGKAMKHRYTRDDPISLIINMVTMLLWKAVIPVALLFSLYTYVIAPRTNIEDYDVLMHFLLLCPIPICALYKIFYSYIHKMNMARLFVPDADLWGPRSMGHRQLAEKNEKLVRV